MDLIGSGFEHSIGEYALHHFSHICSGHFSVFECIAIHGFPPVHFKTGEYTVVVRVLKCESDGKFDGDDAGLGYRAFISELCDSERDRCGIECDDFAL